MAVQVAEEAEPNPAQKDQPTEHEREGRHGGQRAAGAEGTERAARHTEEPCPCEVGLESLSTEDRSDDNG